jgi:hypothetical protein
MAMDLQAKGLDLVLGACRAARAGGGPGDPDGQGGIYQGRTA